MTDDVPEQEPAQDNKPPVIVKRVKKGGHGGHHGGQWKVAYADFVTAMMAFFLLLWLLNATTEEQKRGIADYFSPTPGLLRSTTGGSGFFAGESVTSEGQLTQRAAQPTVSIPIPSMTYDERTEEDEARAQQSEKPVDVDREPPREADDAGRVQKMLAELEERQFAQAEHDLRQAIQDVPELRMLAESLIIDRTPEGLRIQIVDQEKYAMFPRGSAVMHETARKLMARVAQVVEKLPQKISITGHTDSTPYANPTGYDNWDLSTDRANASRRALVDAGLPAERVVHVTGKADQEPLIPDDPTSPRNRRISIVLLREQEAPGEVATKTPEEIGSEAPDAAAAEAPALDVPAREAPLPEAP